MPGSTASIAHSIRRRPPTRLTRPKPRALPKTLREALDALKADTFFREKLGAGFVDYYLHIKNAEIERFQAEVSDWEHREYFEMF